ncbi:Secreted protein of unknown function (DUF3515) [Pontimonas salivibrio]|uniref:DUF3515 domain-containing protein n=1 Tax=Pontimonas salivibrio TaxID=1159327 RepID=A0A2L2BPM3_9MICO|nr:DUF3515 domain-containing protein [Pontimonas salivibrio]AVG23562.1 Secreted protein of unknown function (DUF3515) [Pontimonas salivibrio]
MGRWRTVLTFAAVAMMTLSACAPTVRLQPAPEANAVECANMMVRLPDSIGELERRSVDAQSTAAYGDPTAVIVRCGLPRPGPSTLPCATVDGVDWLIDDGDQPRFVFLSYGLAPATEVIVDSDRVSGTEALQALSGAVASQSAPVGACLGAEDVFSE